jgi:hypothetical protein
MADIKTVQRVPSPEPQAFIDTSPGPEQNADVFPFSLQRLMQFADTQGDISHLLGEGELTELGVKVVREWRIDDGSRAEWKRRAEKSLRIAAQESSDNDDERQPIWENAANVHYPVLTVASQQFAARATPELIKGDKVVGVKVFQPPPLQPGPLEAARAAIPQPSPQQAPQVQQAVQQAQNAANQQSAMDRAKMARGQRVAHYLNYLIFYQMPDWEGETDQLLHELPVVGSAFKKIYMGTTGLCSDYLSALRFTVHNDTKSLWNCPRMTQDFDIYPYEIKEKQALGLYREIDLPTKSLDPEAPRKFLEQLRLDDLDGDDISEPYIVTVDEETQQVLRVEPAYNADDVITDGTKVLRIERWLPFSEFAFLPDPKGRFYKLGFGSLLEPITDSLDTLLNQLLDAGTAQIAGGGFISAGVRLQGSGTGGVLYFQPGEFPVVNVPAGTLQDSIWERTVPQPSAVGFQLFELLLAAAKDIAAVKDVITGEAPSTAPVGTTLALQNQALQVFSSIYKRIYRGFRDEFRLMFRAVKRWPNDEMRKKYRELTNGDLDQDFSGDGTDIQPVADPSVVTKMQKLARIQTLMQLAETPIGQAAGMTQPQAAQEIMRDALDDLDYDRPDRYLAQVAPNPVDIAKAQDMSAAAQLKQADAQAKIAKLPSEIRKEQAETTRTHMESVQKLGEIGAHAHEMRKEEDRIAQTGSVADLEAVQPPEPQGQSPNA